MEEKKLKIGPKLTLSKIRNTSRKFGPGTTWEIVGRKESATINDVYLYITSLV